MKRSTQTTRFAKPWRGTDVSEPGHTLLNLFTLTSSLPLAMEFPLAQMSAPHHSPLEGEGQNRRSLFWWGDRAGWMFSLALMPQQRRRPPTCSPAGYALVSHGPPSLRSPPQGGSDNPQASSPVATPLKGRVITATPPTSKAAPEHPAPARKPVGAELGRHPKLKRRHFRIVLTHLNYNLAAVTTS